MQAPLHLNIVGVPMTLCKIFQKCVTRILFIAAYLIAVSNVLSIESPLLSPSEAPTLISENGKRILPAVIQTGKIKIDGKLNEAAWQSLNFQGDFLQREPIEGAPATERTEVGVLYDDKNIYFGIKCFDNEPDKIIAREMRRDARVDDDDNVEMTLDTYHDKRSAYYFITNPHGSKRDGVFANEGKNYNPNWDGVWYCKAEINDEGWFLEIAIPWKTLRFKENGNSVWGFNCARMIRRKNERVYWQEIPRDYGRGGAGIFRVSEAGTLEGMADLKMGGNLELRPYFLGGLENDAITDFNTEGLTDIGLDTKVALTANLALDITLNTDFAQVEADQEQVNLTRFSLYYPEKREFFLEGAETFSFGTGGFRFWRRRSPDFSLFYSRRIGLVNGHEARIIGGAKMVGKIGRYRVGLMNIFTDDVSYIDDEDNTVKVNASNFSVMRVSRDILNRGSIGMMFLNKEESRSDYYNRSIGLDANIPLSNYLTLSGYAAFTLGPEVMDGDAVIDMNSKNHGAKFSLDYNSDLWQFSASHQDIGANFNPELGFNPRSDYRFNTASVTYSPRPENSKIIRKYEYKIEGNYRADHDNVLLDNKVGASFGIDFHNSSKLNFSLERNKEYIDYDWEVREGFLIPMGTYSGTDVSMRLESDKSRSVAGELNISYGNYYSGKNTSIRLTSTITRIQPIRMEMNYTYNNIDLPMGNFHTNTLGLRMFYFFSTELYVKAYVQWNDDKLYFGGRERIISNILLRWIYSPASNIYLVYNDGRLTGSGGTEITNRTVMLKATFFWRK